jgi:hypothetical protein
MKTEMMTPFSNGTEAMCWMSENCERCSNAWFPKKGIWPEEKTLRQYVRDGKYCKMQYSLDVAHITGEIPVEHAKLIGTGDYGLKETCMMFTDDKDDGKPRKPRKPRDPSGPNQLCFPYELNAIQPHVHIKKEQLTIHQ